MKRKSPLPFAPHSHPPSNYRFLVYHSRRFLCLSRDTYYLSNQVKMLPYCVYCSVISFLHLVVYLGHLCKWRHKDMPYSFLFNSCIIFHHLYVLWSPKVDLSNWYWLGICGFPVANHIHIKLPIFKRILGIISTSGSLVVVIGDSNSTSAPGSNTYWLLVTHYHVVTAGSTCLSLKGCREYKFHHLFRLPCHRWWAMKVEPGRTIAWYMLIIMPPLLWNTSLGLMCEPPFQ